MLIIDESDERMFKDLEAFYKATKSEKVITICLTATAYEGGNDGLQRTALEELGYKVYYNTTKKEDYEPVIHQTRELGSLEARRALIIEASQKCGVLIYATG